MRPQDPDQGRAVPFVAALVDRFHLGNAPTLTAHVSPSAPPVAFSRMRSDRPQRGRSISPRPENAFTFQVPLIPAAFSDLKYANRSIALPEVQEPGRAFLFDLSARPTVGLDTEFDNLRFYISQSTIEEIAREKGLRHVGGLIQPNFGDRDPILYQLAEILVPALENPHLVSKAFVEYLALAFHEHVVTSYGGVPSVARHREPSLAPWQVRRIGDLVEADLAGNPSISDLARECGLSPSYFAFAFRKATNVSPHKWIMRRRVERAKALLRDTELSLALIAAECGFFDPSHFSRVFRQMEGRRPSEWRRDHRSG